MTTVGVVGTGRMGFAMTRALRAAGLEVLVYNRTRARADQCAFETGATVAPTAADVAARADVTLTMLADDDAVHDVYRGPAGLLEGAHGGAVLVDLSTVTPNTIRSLEADARATGSGILDSPVSGSVTLAGSGQLTLMVGGTAGDLERARPALEPLAKTIVHVGPLGSGAAMKLAVNTVLADSAVGAPYVGYTRAAFLAPEATPVAFALDLAAKDLRLIRALADEVGLDLPQSQVNLDVVRTAS